MAMEMVDASSIQVRSLWVINRMLVRLAVLLISCYQSALRPFLVGTCKFCPTCSDYAKQAMQRHGLYRGGWLSVKRLCRCHPFGIGGIDPVP